ncbi:universal stress protein [Halopiger djelfimassiliensis]|uniref:universal stress protein n=1 Tax=Halopiger djelfimassiliensis TaxID=1293047 RepID=UPI000677AB55|nr:universal stress protein [Halopiger djelfimassiliensis]
MVTSILLAVDPDDTARAEELAAHTIDVARPTDATVVLAHVIGTGKYEDEVQSYHEAIDRIGFDVQNRSLPPESLAKETEPVGEIAERIEDAGIDVEVKAAVGDRATEIVQLADVTDVDLVVVGGRKRSPTGKAVFGSSAQKILLNAPCPVTYVREGTV